MTRVLRVGLLSLLLLCGVATPSRSASVTSGSLRVQFAVPPGWTAASRPPQPLLSLYQPKGGGNFPHLAVTEGEAGSADEALEKVRGALPRFFAEQGIQGARVLAAPRAVQGPSRVEFAYAGRLGEVACDWFQVVLPGKDSGLVFTFAFPRGTLEHWRSALDAFGRSLRVGS